MIAFGPTPPLSNRFDALVSLTHQGTNSVRLKWLPLRSKSVSLNLASSPRTLREYSHRTYTEGHLRKINKGGWVKLQGVI